MVYSSRIDSLSGYGRPRDEAATGRIYDAVEYLLSRRGYAGTTVGSVSSRARVGSKTIYRRWANRDEMIVAALEVRVGVPDFDNSGDTFMDLMTMLGPGGTRYMSRYRLLLGSAIVLEAKRHPEFLMVFRRRFIWPLRRSLDSVLRRAVRRGELRDDVDLDLVIDLLLGVASSRFWSDDEFEVGFVSSSIRLVLGGCMRRGVSADLDGWVDRR